jgi:hypothetical protein
VQDASTLADHQLCIRRHSEIVGGDKRLLYASNNLERVRRFLSHEVQHLAPASSAHAGRGFHLAVRHSLGEAARKPPPFIPNHIAFVAGAIM